MANEMVERNSAPLRSVMSIELYPALMEDDCSIAMCTKLPISKLSALGTAFEPIETAVQNVVNGPGAVSGLYKVTIPSGTHLASFQNGTGNLGTALNANNQIAGQAVLNPLVCNPTMIFMAAALASIDKKLDAIQEIQQEMLDFLIQKERAELRGDLVFLSDIMNNYRFNWDNDMYKNSNHVKVLDIRQAAEQRIFFYRNQIASKLNKKTILHSDGDVQKQINRVQADFKEYQLSLYLYSFSSFLDVMLVGNYAAEYLSGIKGKIEEYAWQYRELYTRCYDQLENYFDTSIQSTLLKSIGSISKATGKAFSHIPVINGRQMNNAIIESGKKLEKLEEKRTTRSMKHLVERQSSCVRPFVDNIEMLEQLYNNPINLLFDKDTIYLNSAKTAEKQ